MRRLRLLVAVLGLAASALFALSFVQQTHLALADDGHGGLQAVPEVFVGTAKQCAPYPAGSNIVTAAWLTGLGLPDDGSPANAAPAHDPRSGLLLSKNGPTTDCSSAGARITGLDKGTTVSELGFDFRNGTHCGAGAPRFNITTTDGSVYFAGCADGTITAAPQDPAQWSRVRFADSQIYPAGAGEPAFALGMTKIKSIEIVYDEGTDATSLQDPNGAGLVVLDNIDVGGRLITSGPADSDNGGENDGRGGNGG